MRQPGSAFFDSYQRFIVDQARFAQKSGVEMFAVGIEYEKTTHREQEWRRIIAAVREVYDGRVTYARELGTLSAGSPFLGMPWIGSEFTPTFPLSLEQDPSQEVPVAGLERAAATTLDPLVEVIGDKPIFFAEIGYSRSPQCGA